MGRRLRSWGGRGYDVSLGGEVGIRGWVAAVGRPWRKGWMIVLPLQH